MRIASCYPQRPVALFGVCLSSFPLALPRGRQGSMARSAPPPKQHPALMAKLAWQELIQHLITEHGFKHQYVFAEAIDVSVQTLSRWLGKKPALPERSSFEKVAACFEMSENDLARMWLSFMSRRYAPYPPRIPVLAPRSWSRPPPTAARACSSRRSRSRSSTSRTFRRSNSPSSTTSAGSSWSSPPKSRHRSDRPLPRGALLPGGSGLPRRARAALVARAGGRGRDFRADGRRGHRGRGPWRRAGDRSHLDLT